VDTTKWVNIYIPGLPKEKTEKGIKRLFGEIIAEDFLK
jgi:hypothetical protein